MGDSPHLGIFNSGINRIWGLFTRVRIFGKGGPNQKKRVWLVPPLFRIGGLLGGSPPSRGGVYHLPKRGGEIPPPDLGQRGGGREKKTSINIKGETTPHNTGGGDTPPKKRGGGPTQRRKKKHGGGGGNTTKRGRRGGEPPTTEEGGGGGASPPHKRKKGGGRPQTRGGEGRKKQITQPGRTEDE